MREHPNTTPAVQEKIRTAVRRLSDPAEDAEQVMADFYNSLEEATVPNPAKSGRVVESEQPPLHVTIKGEKQLRASLSEARSESKSLEDIEFINQLFEYLDDGVDATGRKVTLYEVRVMAEKRLGLGRKNG